MPALRQLLAAYSPLLVLDAASARVHTGVLDAGAPARWRASEEEAGVALFRGVEALGFDPSDAGAFVFCEGPGSILGVRTAAMALRAWGVLRARPVFAYQSLALVAHALDDAALSIIADARRETWHCYRRDRGLRRVATAELAGPLATPEGFRHWSAPPPGVTTTPYDVPALLERTRERDLLRVAEAPDAFLHAEPSYATWTPRVHRAPAP